MKADRPRIPRYLKNIEKDEDERRKSFKPRERPQTENLIEIGRLFTERLAKQEELSKERRRRRYVLARKIEREHKAFVSHLHKSKAPVDELRAYLERMNGEKRGRLAKKREAEVEEKRAVESANQSPVGNQRTDEPPAEPSE
jgi:hypothetical protein